MATRRGLSTTRKARTASPSGLRRGGRTTSGLPAGGVIPDDYHFEGDRGPVKLSELFAPGKDTLAVYSFMYGPERERPCPGCTHFLYGLDARSSTSVNVSTSRSLPNRPCGHHMGSPIVSPA
jgi:hypothetical protein